MPTTRTKRARGRAGALDHWKLDDLVTGDCLLAGVGYAGLIPGGRNQWAPADCAAVRDAMCADWQLHGSAVMAWWRGETERFTRHPGNPEDQRERLRACLALRGQTEPWARQQFGSPQEGQINDRA